MVPWKTLAIAEAVVLAPLLVGATWFLVRFLQARDPVIRFARFMSRLIAQQRKAFLFGTQNLECLKELADMLDVSARFVLGISYPRERGHLGVAKSLDKLRRTNPGVPRLDIGPWVKWLEATSLTEPKPISKQERRMLRDLLEASEDKDSPAEASLGSVEVTDITQGKRGVSLPPHPTMEAIDNENPSGETEALGEQNPKAPDGGDDPSPR